jgi:hypothetical protein
MTDAEMVRRGERAKRLLEDEMLVGAFDAVHGAIVRKWEETPLRDRDGAHELRLMLKLLKDVRVNLETAVRDGKLSALHIEQEKRKKRFGVF